MRRVAGLLLTGGASSRMGVAKTELRIGGERLAARAAAVLTSVCDPVLEVGPGATGLETVREPEDHGGPLVALVAGAGALRERGHTGALVLLGVDLPFVDAPLLELLASRVPGDSTVVPLADEVPQWLCARYGPVALTEAGRLVASGVRSLRALLECTAWEPVDEDEWHLVAPPDALADVDTPADVERFGLEWPG